MLLDNCKIKSGRGENTGTGKNGEVNSCLDDMISVEKPNKIRERKLFQNSSAQLHSTGSLPHNYTTQYVLLAQISAGESLKRLQERQRIENKESPRGREQRQKIAKKLTRNRTAACCGQKITKRHGVLLPFSLRNPEGYLTKKNDI